MVLDDFSVESIMAISSSVDGGDERDESESTMIAVALNVVVAIVDEGCTTKEHG